MIKIILVINTLKLNKHLLKLHHLVLINLRYNLSFLIIFDLNFFIVLKTLIFFLV
jgi:hypothetical protein